jgi:diazepam-binding inhibitor (GABA receptor modulator, acyl-CoA-binding protein)
LAEKPLLLSLKKMPNKSLDEQFKEAFEAASSMTQQLPPDVMLRIYAYYKQATDDPNAFNLNNNYDLRNAFKMNAWLQISHITAEEAKTKYIEIINSILNNK